MAKLTLGLPEACIGGILGAGASAVLVTGGWLHDPVASPQGIVVAAQAHAILTMALSMEVADTDFIDGFLPRLTAVATKLPEALLSGIAALIYYVLALAWVLALVWGGVKLFGTNGLLAFLDDWAWKYPLELIVGGLFAGAWALFGVLFCWPLFIEDGGWLVTLLGQGLLVLMLGGAMSVVVGLFFVVPVLLIDGVLGVSFPPIDGMARAALVGSLYGSVQGYVIGRFLG